MSGISQQHLQTPAPAIRLVLLGASNLTLSLRTVIELMQERFGHPSEVLVAAGHGRSYGMYSQVLIRGLPGITSSGLWVHLESADIHPHPLPTYAILMDIGNDIPYGYLPEQILTWVGECVERLQQQDARIVMSNIPMAAVEPLSELHFKIVRSLFFPFSRLTRNQVVERAWEVQGGLVEMAANRQFELFEPDPDWYGPDAMHVLYWKRRAFYRQLINRLPQASDTDSAAMRPARQKGWRKRACFSLKQVLGRERHCQQPSGQLNDRSLVYKY